jgi:DNA-binding LacI/PurR family transcriptional regulator
MMDSEAGLKAMKDKSPREGKIRLRDIASAANVSVATTSRVLSGSGRVAPEIQKIVLEEAKRLGVDPSQRNKSKTLAFVLSNRAMLHVFHSRILSGAEMYCATHGWDIIFLSFNYALQAPWTELHLPKVIQRSDLVRGVILAGTNSTNLTKLLTERGIKFAVFGNNLIGEPQDFENNDMVVADDIQGSQDATRFLIELGHRNIWFVGNTSLPWFARCFDGYRRAMEMSGLIPRESRANSEDDTESGYLGTKSLLAQDEPVTAIVAGNDPTAYGVYKALRDRNLKIPSDISVVGCDDTIGKWLSPALSTTVEFPEQIGKQLVELALNRISKPDQPPQRITVPTEFIRRDSCCSPAARHSGSATQAAITAGDVLQMRLNE